ncbi:MAG: hypothetical protein WCA46_15415 [Actinocatenispora sp.]
MAVLAAPFALLMFGLTCLLAGLFFGHTLGRERLSRRRSAPEPRPYPRRPAYQPARRLDPEPPRVRPDDRTRELVSV